MAQHGSEYEYLREAVAGMLVERIHDIARDFPAAMDLGCHSGICLQELVKLAEQEVADSDDEMEVPGGIEKLVMVDSSKEMIQQADRVVAEATKKVAEVSNDPTRLSVETVVSPLAQVDSEVGAESVDLVFSSMALHWENNLTETLKAAQRVLKPDGAFLGAMLGGDTLYELRTSLAVAEQEREGGIGAHVSPMVRNSDACGLLSAAGFNLTTVDTATIAIEYKNAFECMRHLGMMGEGNAVRNRRPTVSRDTFLAAAAAYESLFAEDGHVPVTFEVIFMIGWKPHASQPKPLRPQVAGKSLGSLGKGFDLTETKAPKR